MIRIARDQRGDDVATHVDVVDDLFMHARGCSRRCRDGFEQLGTLTKQNSREHHTSVSLERLDVSNLFDLFVLHENAVSNFLATIAPAIVERIAQIEAIAPGYRNAELCNLKPEAVDELVRPIFEAAGLAGDFIPWSERFPAYQPSDD